MFLKEFTNLRRKRSKLLGLPDQLNYAIPVDDFTIALKDGAFLSAFECEGLDLNSASAEELDAHRAQANRALARLDDGFMYNVDLIRHPSVEYPTRTFPDPVSAMLDREREVHYSAEGQHFETTCVLTITYRPPADVQTKIAGVFLSGAPKQVNWQRQLDWFKQRLREFADAISPVWKLTPLQMPALLSHLATCIIGRTCDIAAPRPPIFLDAVLGNQDFIAGFKPRIGGRHIRVVALSGFPPFSYAEMAAFLSELPICYRYSIRGIPVGPRTAISQLSVYRRNWFQKRLGLRGVISEHFGSGAGAAFQNQHALRMAADADEAITEAEAGALRYCYVTPKVIITEDRADMADENAQLVFKVCQSIGFDPRIESINAVEAWLGSIPGHGWYDIRRPLVNTQNLADILPLTSIWPGLATNPCPYYPNDTPALCYGATTGSTPFRFNLHVGDTGHTGIYGPTGSGKSVALGTIATNFRAVPDGQLFFFDKGYSAYVLTKALGGQHLDLGEDEVPLQPLARIDDETDRMRLQTLLEDWLELHGVRLIPNQRKALWHALTLVAEGPVEQRTISNLVTQVQDNVVRDGLGAFSLAGPLGRFLDADRDVMLEGRFVTFELETLMAMGPKVVVPIATYLFHRIDQRLDGRPTLIILDEAWIMLTNSVFGAKIEEWLRTLRKKNAAVVLATQSLSEIANSPHRDVLLESCPTKLYLPNPEAKNAASREMYRRFGLTDRQIEIVAEATPKRHYYYTSPLGRRLFQFSLGPAALAFIGAGSKDDVLSARRMIKQHGERWTSEWLRSRELDDWAEYLDKLYGQVASPVEEIFRAKGNSFHANGKINQGEIRQ
ncbi:MAG: conjugal transfer protein TrbE [Candidatus Binataceae bacterium]|nr:conjugal transfer protein TrbE [Candidatus Binataceae bacterium]